MSGSLTAVLTAAPRPAVALDNGLAKTPPMGFNDWNSFGCNVDEALIKQTADFFVSSGMKAAGYRYVNIDDCWLTHQRDAQGRLVPDPAKFPDGIKGTADYVHSKGLKLGIYEDAGTQTCAGYPGSLGHEKIDAQTFADWGVDYLKYDNCNNAGSTTKAQYVARYTAMRDALAATGRKIVFSICEWGVNDPATWAGDVGNLWRTTGDISDNWSSLKSIIAQNAPLAAHAHPGAWNDPDMLEVGNGGMTDTEYRTHFSLWAEMAAPLLVGSDLRKASPATMKILLNKDVIAVDQDRLGVQGQVLSNDGGHWVFSKPLANGDRAVALYNETDAPATITTTAAQTGLRRASAYRMHDLWSGQNTETAGTIGAQVPPHGTVIYRVSSGGAAALAPATSASVDPAPVYDGATMSLMLPGHDNAVGTSFTDYGRAPVTDARMTLVGPAGWQVNADGRSNFARVGSGRTVHTDWTVRTPDGVAPGDYTLTLVAGYRWHNGVRTDQTAVTVTVPPAAPTADAWVSDLTWLGSTNGWGPVERDMSNGETAAGDGKPITIGGQVFAKGLGTNSPSTVDVYVGGKCATFTAQVGVDDEEGANGTVAFQVLADGKQVASTPTLTNADAPMAVSADTSGAQVVRLVVSDGGDGNTYDHADWGSAQLHCGSAG